MYKHRNERQTEPNHLTSPSISCSRIYQFLGQVAVPAQESTHSRNKSKDGKIRLHGLQAQGGVLRGSNESINQVIPYESKQIRLGGPQGMGG
jgi:hypothetical protein